MARFEIPNAGVWSALSGMFNTLFTELFNFRHVGIYDYSDTGTSTTPLVLPADTWVFIPNDGLGEFSTSFPLANVDNVWDAVTDKFDFSSLSLGDKVDIRLDATITTSSPNAEVSVSIDLAIGSPSPYTIRWTTLTIKNASTKGIISFGSLYVGNEATKLNPAQFKITSDVNATLVVNGWYVAVTKGSME